MKAVVAGGGIAGRAISLGLARIGWNVTVYEQAECVREVGAGIQMSPNACKVLRWLGVLEDIAKDASIPQRLCIRDGLTGDTFMETSLDAVKQRWGGPYLHVHRADLLQALADAGEKAGVRVSLGSLVTATEPSGLVLPDGSRPDADLIIGADGVRSQVRHIVSKGDGRPKFSGQIAWRGLIPRRPGEDYPQATVWAGDGSHLVTYPLRKGRLLNVVAVTEDSEWTAENWTNKGSLATLQRAFAGWHPEVTSILAALPDAFAWGLFERPEMTRVSGKTALIGDAARPILPFMAQGAAMALEDTAALVNCLSLPGSSSLEERLLQYQYQRRTRVRRVSRLASDNAVMFHLPDGVERKAVRAKMDISRMLAPDMTARRLDWLYGFDPLARVL